MTIKTELLAIQQETSDNILRAEDVVEWARDNPGSALHKSIEWDNAKAADAHRLWQVRRLVQLYVVADDGAPRLVSLSFDRENGGGYRAIDDVVKVPDLREIMLRDALAELDRVRVKYERVQELADVWNAAAAAQAKARKRKGGDRAAA